MYEMSQLNSDRDISSGSVRAAIVLGTVGVLSFIVQPGLVQGFVTSLGVSEATANDLAFREMLGIAVATVLAVLIGDRISWRIQAVVALAVACLGNILSALAGDVGLLALARLLTGLGAGFVISISFTVVGIGSRAERNLGYYLVVLLTYGALGLWVMPTVIEAFGLRSLFVVWAVVSGLAITAALALPAGVSTPSQDEDADRSAARNASVPIIAMLLLGVLAYNISIGVAWANLFLIGIDAGIAEQSIANALLICQFTAVAGALAAVYYSERVNGAWPILVGTLGGAMSIGLVLGHPTYLSFLVALVLFNTLWNFAMPFILGLAANATSAGRLVTVAVAFQMIGLAFGPLLASSLLGDGSGFEAIKWASIALMVVTMVFFAPPLWERNQHLRAQSEQA